MKSNKLIFLTIVFFCFANVAKSQLENKPKVVMGKSFVYFDDIIPAKKILPKELRKIVIVDRLERETVVGKISDAIALLNNGEMIPTKEAQKSFAFLFSYRGNKHNKHCAEDLKYKLSNYIKRSPRLFFVNRDMKLGDSKINEIPSKLNWDKVNKICTETQSDAILSIEFLNIKTSVKHASGGVSKGGGNINVRYSSHLDVFIEIGFCLYDNNSKTIIDEFVYNDTRHVDLEGKAVIDGILDLFLLTGLLKNNFNYAGYQMSEHIAPQYKSTHRGFFSRIKKHPLFENAAVLFVNKKYDEAAKIWDQIASSKEKRRIKGKAIHNLAVYYELKGELRKAYSLAKKAYSEHGITASLLIMEDITPRINKANLVREQMGGEYNQNIKF